MTLTPQVWNWKNLAVGPAWLTEQPAEQPIVWQATRADDVRIESHLTALLSPAERSRLMRFQQREDQQRFLTGRGLLRILIGAHLNIPATHVELGEGPFGKPFVITPGGTPSIFFNVAHAGRLVLLAFHRTHEIGVDVEEIRPSDDLAAVARLVFTPHEYQDWLQLAPAEQLIGFYKKWTRHEAGLKALSTGISDNAQPSEEARLARFDLALPEEYQGAVACLQLASSNRQ